MLYKTDTMTMPARVQGAFLSSQEVQDVVEFVKEHNEAYYDDAVATYINNSERGESSAARAATTVWKQCISRRCVTSYPWDRRLYP